MKKLLAFLLVAVFLLAGCSGAKKDAKIADFDKNKDVVRIKSEVKENERLFGIAFLGYAQGDYEDVKEVLREKEYYSHFSFLETMTEERFFENEGNEVYAIVPLDDSVTITVNKYEFDEKFNFTTGEEIIKISDGQPFAVRGNVADFIPNIIIKAEKGNRSTEYTPTLSGEDGKLHIMNNEVYDFSVYE